MDKETPLALAKEVTEFFSKHFVMPKVTVYATHIVGKTQEDNPNKRAICAL